MPNAQKLQRTCKLVKLSLNVAEQSDFEALESLEELKLTDYLYGQKYSSETFSKLVNLNKLFLGSNCFHNNTSILNKLHRLTSFETFNSCIKVLPEGFFDNNSALQVIGLKMNELMQLEKNVFANNALLQSIDLNHNQLEHLDKDLFMNKAQFQSIELRNNHLEQRGEDLFSNNAKLPSINLDFQQQSRLIEHHFMNKLQYQTDNLFTNQLMEHHMEFFPSKINLERFKLRIPEIRTIL